MQTRRFGKTELQITPIGFGAWAIGGGNWEYAWGAQDDRESIAAIHKALDLGINWIDTAAAYGLGHSEEIVAEALKGMAERPLIFTKCSLVWNENREISSVLKADSVRREVEDSLRRLQTDCIDLYQIHWPDPDADIEEVVDGDGHRQFRVGSGSKIGARLDLSMVALHRNDPSDNSSLAPIFEVPVERGSAVTR